MSGQETHYYYATEYQMVFIEKLEAMRKELCSDEMKLVPKYNGKWWIYAMCGGIFGASTMFTTFILNPQSVVSLYWLLAITCFLIVGLKVYIDCWNSTLFERQRYAIQRRRKKLKEAVDKFDNDELTTNNCQRLTNQNLMLIELKDAQSRVNRLKKSLMDRDFFEGDHNMYLTLTFIGVLIYLVPITYMVFFLHSWNPSNCYYYPSSYWCVPPPSNCYYYPSNYWCVPPPSNCQCGPLNYWQPK